ncbi:MAG TPA: glycosyltransferase family 39 protein, partial [Ktedonobacterales bacterium]|nr:glycosyltransferase family 39 protein [Ktedonobacterales bacterium]
MTATRDAMITTETLETTTPTRRGIPSVARRALLAIQADWAGSRVWTFGAATLALATLVCEAYYLNQPYVQTDPDTVDYTRLAKAVAAGHLVDPIRTPVYPLFIHLISLVGGQGNLFAVALAQAALYVLACGGVYLMALRLVGRPPVAFLVAALLDTNTLLLSYVKPIMTEALALFLVTALALVIAWHARSARARTLWLASGVLLLLAMTRPEWVYFGVPLLGFLLLVSWRQGKARPHLRHVALALVLFYAVCGLYSYENGVVNGTPGFSVNQNIDWLGKVMQYHMQNEAPPQYAAISREVSAYLAFGDYDSLHVISHDPNLLRNRMALAGVYGRAIVARHPIEYALKTVPVIFQSLRSTTPHQPVRPRGAFGAPLRALNVVSSLAQQSTALFPFLALGWWAWLLARRRDGWDERTLLMCGLALIAGYGLAVTTLFVFIQYPRMNTPYDPLMLTVVWCSVALVIPRAVRLVRRH